MPYKTITIHNFKGISEIRLDFSRHATSNVYALVGLNESGKTTVLESIHWLSSPASYELQDIIPMAQKANFNGVVEVSGELKLTQEYREKLAGFLLKKHKFELEGDPNITFTRRRAFEKSRPTTEASIAFYSLTLRGVNRRTTSKAAVTLSASTKAYSAAHEYLRTFSPQPAIFLYKDFLFKFPDEIYIELLPGKKVDGYAFYKTMIEDILQSRYPGESIQSLLVDRLKSGEDEDLDNVRAVLDDLTVMITNTVVSQWGRIFQNQGDVVIPNSLQVILADKIFKDDWGYYLRLNVKNLC